MVHVGLTVVEPVGHGWRCKARGGVLCGSLVNLKLVVVSVWSWSGNLTGSSQARARGTCMLGLTAHCCKLPYTVAHRCGGAVTLRGQVWCGVRARGVDMDTCLGFESPGERWGYGAAGGLGAWRGARWRQCACVDVPDMTDMDGRRQQTLASPLAEGVGGGRSQVLAD